MPSGLTQWQVLALHAANNGKISRVKSKSPTEWVNCTAFGKLGEIIGRIPKEGQQVFISGKMKTEKYTGNDGVEKYPLRLLFVTCKCSAANPTTPKVASKPHSKADIISRSNSDQRRSSNKGMVISLKDLSSSNNQLILGKVCRRVMTWDDDNSLLTNNSPSRGFLLPLI